MSDRDRLIELIDGFVFGTQIAVNNIEWDSTKVKELADYLIANGIIMLPLPIETTVYEIRARGKWRTLRGYRKCDYAINNELYLKNAIEHKLELYVKEKAFTKTDRVRFNKTVFGTQEEAEKALERIRKK